MKNVAVALTVSAGVFGGIGLASANAGPVSTVVDSEVGTRLFRISEKLNSGVFEIERALSDDVVGAYCQWTASGFVDFAARNVTKIRIAKQECKVLEDSDTDQWIDRASIDSEILFPNQRTIITPDAATNVVIESRQTGPNQFNVVSEFRRTWNYNANKVCLYTEERIQGKQPYITSDLGCYDIPDNNHARKILNSLKP